MEVELVSATVVRRGEQQAQSDAGVRLVTIIRPAARAGHSPRSQKQRLDIDPGNRGRRKTEDREDGEPAADVRMAEDDRGSGGTRSRFQSRAGVGDRQRGDGSRIAQPVQQQFERQLRL